MSTLNLQCFMYSTFFMIVWTHFVGSPLFLDTFGLYSFSHILIWGMGLLLAILLQSTLILKEDYDESSTGQWTQDTIFKIVHYNFRLLIISLLLIPKLQYFAYFCFDKDTYKLWATYTYFKVGKEFNLPHFDYDSVEKNAEKITEAHLEKYSYSCQPFHYFAFLIIVLAYLFLIHLVPNCCTWLGCCQKKTVQVYHENVQRQHQHYYNVTATEVGIGSNGGAEEVYENNDDDDNNNHRGRIDVNSLTNRRKGQFT